LEQGPLYQFLKAVIDDTPRDEKARLHVIHVRDWHHTSDSFDEERRRYGLHCMAETWAAEPIEGYEQYLQPWHGNADAQAAALTSTGYTPEGSHVTFYDVRSNSLFDFKPDEGNKGVGLREILDRIIGTNPRQRVYVIVIGVYTDIKVKILLTSLRERYDIKNLIVSDVLTGAPSLERHLAGLDFVQKVLSVEVTHSLDELAQVLSQSERKHHISDTIIRNSTSFRQYQTYFLDKQNLLAYQEQKQLEYLELTKRRATRVYKIILLANYALLVFGITFVLLAIIAALLGIFSPSRVSSDYLTGTGILGVAGLAQLVMIFFTNPINTLQKNLTHLVKLQLGVESRGLRMALMRYHFARPERLYPQDPVLEEQELANVRHQLELIQSFSKDTLDELQDKTGEETAETPL
jgi:nicotinamidase-related amidase